MQFCIKNEKENEGKIVQKVHSELACVDAILRTCKTIDIFVLLILLDVNSYPHERGPFICAVVCRKVSIRIAGRIVRKNVAEKLKILTTGNLESKY